MEISSFCTNLLENPANLLADNIFTHMSETKNFKNLGFVQEQSKEYKISLLNKFSEN